MYAELNQGIPYNTYFKDKSGCEKIQDFGKVSFDSNYIGGASTLALKTTNKCNSKVSLLFFSGDNISRIQSQIREAVFEKSNGKIKIIVDQDENHLIIAMTRVFAYYSENRENHVVRQVKELNRALLDYIVPDMITNAKQQYLYVKHINEAIQPIPLPINVNSKGRKALLANNMVSFLR